MASVKVKFRPSSIDGKEGSIYYQVIHNRVVRHIRTDYRIFESEWNGKLSMIEVIYFENNYATLFLSIVPMMFIYPFIQKYFVKGVMIGSLKG